MERPDSEEIKKMYEEDKKIRLQACQKEVEILLKKYNCSMRVSLQQINETTVVTGPIVLVAN